MAMIEVENFSFSYPHSESKALNSVDLAVEKGEFLLLCGKSGCGKTTLLRSLKSEIAPHGEKRGDIRINGKVGLPLSESARTVGFVMQDPDNQIVTDTVWHELAFGLENLSVETDVIRRRVGEVAHFFGIQSWFEKSVFELSGGQKQILNLAAATAMQTEILVLDEPTAQLDPIAAKEFLQMLTRINRELGKTVVLSEHRLEELLPICDNVFFMQDGKGAFHGAPKAFAAFLQGSEDLQARDFQRALPVPTRTALRLGEAGDVPLSVKEGRSWLAAEAKKHRFTRATPPEISMQQRQAAIRAKDLWFRYDAKDAFVLRGMGLDIKQGDVHCVVGGNGSGKSTMLGVMAGLHKPQRGKVAIQGNGKVSMLVQNPKAVFSGDTVWDDLCGKRTGIDDKVHEVAEKLGIRHLYGRHSYDLSGGEMQKAALAKLLLQEPDILLLDEPTKGLDAFSKAELAQVFRALQAEGKTIVIVTHDLEFAAEYADACSMMFGGDIIAHGEGSDFFLDNAFYTTGASRMTRGIVEECATEGEIVCNGH